MLTSHWVSHVHAPMCTLTRMHIPPSIHTVCLKSLGSANNHLNTPTPPSTDTWSLPHHLHGKCFSPRASGQDSPFSHECLLSYLWSGGSLGQILGSLPVA